MPKYNVTFITEALMDLNEIIAYLDEQQPGLGHDFAFEVAELMFRLEANPGIYQFVHNNIQRGKIGKFQHVAFYTVAGNTVEILQIVHGSSDIEYFK